MSNEKTNTPSNADGPRNCLERLVLLRDHHLAKAKVFTDQANDARSDLDRLEADGDGPKLYPGRWPEVVKYNEGLIAHERAQAADHATLADTAEMARLLLQNTKMCQTHSADQAPQQLKT